MEFNDQSGNLYCDPNAYVLNCPIYCNKPPKKVVFSEPYFALPNFYINNNFKRGNCSCVPKPKPNQPNNCSTFGNFNFGGLGEMFGKLMAGGGINKLLSSIGGGGIGGIISALAGLNNSNSKDNQTSLNNNAESNPLSTLLNNNTIGSLLNLFRQNQPKQITPNSTSSSIKDYVKVE